MKWSYTPLRVMIEPRGMLLFGFFRWLYFRNPRYYAFAGRSATYLRICGWCRVFPRNDHAQL